MYSNLRKQEEYVSNLPDAEKKSLEWYTSGAYRDFNKALREGKILTQIQREHKDNIDSAFESVPPLEEPIIVYKGKGSDNVYSDKSFVSTTLNYESSKRFSGSECCVLQITVSAGSRVLPLRTISEMPDEEEVLLNRGDIAIVTGNAIKDRMKIIFTTYCPKDSKPVHTDEEIGKADRTFNSKLVVETLISTLSGEDPEFLDEETVKMYYKKLTGGKSITDSDLKTVSKRLNIG